MIRWPATCTLVTMSLMGELHQQSQARGSRNEHTVSTLLEQLADGLGRNSGLRHATQVHVVFWLGHFLAMAVKMHLRLHSWSAGAEPEAKRNERWRRRRRKFEKHADLAVGVELMLDTAGEAKPFA